MPEVAEVEARAVRHAGSDLGIEIVTIQNRPGEAQGYSHEPRSLQCEMQALLRDNPSVPDQIGFGGGAFREPESA